MEVGYDLLPLTSPRLVKSRGQQRDWEWQCDHEDDGRVGLPEIPVSNAQVRAVNENDRLAEYWLNNTADETTTGPLAFTEALWFQSFVGFVIACNSVIIGVETDYETPMWGSIENSLLLFFVIEISLRIAHHGWRFIFSAGNVFDMAIVCSGVFDMWFMPMVDIVLGRQEDGGSAVMSVIQMLRLLRIIRLIRLVKIIQPLYRLALGIAEAIQGMFWVLVFLAMMLYAVSILFTRLIGHDPTGMRYEYNGIYTGQEVCSGGCSLDALDVDPGEVRQLFHSVLSSMFVLFESMSCWSLMRFTPLFDRAPLMKAMAVAFYIFTAWALLAVMTGVVSEKMIAAGEKKNFDAENIAKEKQVMAKQALKDLFLSADADGSGEINKEEFNNMLMWTDITKQLMQHASVNVQDLHELFEWLDRDGDGMVSVNEFLDGFEWLSGKITPKSFLKLQEQVGSDLGCVEATLIDFLEERFDNFISAVSQPLRKIHALTEQIQRVDVQLGTKCNSNGSQETVAEVTEDLVGRGPSTALALRQFEEKMNKRLDRMLDLVQNLDRLQAKGLIRLKRGVRMGVD